jgi:chromosome segregation ATPase
MANILLENEQLRAQLAEAQENEARVTELTEAMTAANDHIASLRIQVAAHENRIGTLTEERDGLTARLTAADEAHAKELAAALNLLDESNKQNKSVAAGVAAKLNQIGQPPVDVTETDTSAGQQTWAEKYSMEPNPRIRAEIWAEHRDDILDGK